MYRETGGTEQESPAGVNRKSQELYAEAEREREGEGHRPSSFPEEAPGNAGKLRQGIGKITEIGRVQKN